LVAISSSLFLILHTRDLHSRLKKMEVRLQPGEDGEPALVREHTAIRSDRQPTTEDTKNTF